MADDPIRFSDTVDWLDKARLDLRGIEVDLAADPPLVAVLSQLPPDFRP